MSKSDDRRREEKERLWNEVMGKNRTYESTEASQEITLTILYERECHTIRIIEITDRVEGVRGSCERNTIAYIMCLVFTDRIGRPINDFASPCSSPSFEDKSLFQSGV
jgi:hypothetical protein